MLRGGSRPQGPGSSTGAGGGRPAQQPSMNMGSFLKGRDLSQVDDGLVFIPDGTFVTLKCIKAVGQKSQAGNPMIVLTHTVTSPEEWVGKTVRDNLTFTEKSEWKYKGCARIAGLLSEDGKEFIGNDEQDFVDKEWGAIMKIGSYQGSPKQEIAGGYKYLDGGGVPGGDDNGSNEQMFGGLPGDGSYSDALPGEDSPFNP